MKFHFRNLFFLTRQRVQRFQEMEKKRFIEFNQIVHVDPNTGKVFRIEPVTSFVDRSIVKTIVRYPTRNTNTYLETPGGYYFISRKNVQFRIKNESDVLDLVTEKVTEQDSPNVIADAIAHLTTELSYNPGRIGAGSEYLQAMDRQRETFELPPSFIPPPQHKGT